MNFYGGNLKRRGSLSCAACLFFFLLLDAYFNFRMRTYIPGVSFSKVTTLDVSVSPK